MDNKNLECDIVKDLLPLYLEQEISRGTERWIQRHLETCQDCRETFRHMNGSFTDVLKENERKRKRRARSLKKLEPWILFCGYLLLLFLLCSYFILDLNLFALR